MPSNKATLQELTAELIEKFRSVFERSLNPNEVVLTEPERRHIGSTLQNWRRVLQTMKSTERELELMVDRKLAVDALVQSKTADGTRFADVLHDLQRWMRANTKPTKGLSLRDAMYEEIGRVAVLGAGFSPDSGTIDYRGLTEHSLLQSLYVTLERLPAHARSELSGLRDAVIKEAGNVLNTASAKHDDNAFGAELLWYCGEVDSVARQWLGDQAMVPVLAEAVLPVLRHFAKQDSLIHPAGTIPPDHFHEKGVACGPIMGTKTALGYALHGDNNLTVQRYSQYLNERLAEQIAWVRKAKSGREFEMFVKTIRLRDTCLNRVLEYNAKPANESE